jgi:thioredoxin-like negative regulator of GroEL
MNRRKRWPHQKEDGRVTQALSSVVQQVLAVALQHFQVGQLDEAERLFRQVLAKEPRHTDCLHLLGLIA